jgi:hypothetical protein
MDNHFSQGVVMKLTGRVSAVTPEELSFLHLRFFTAKKNASPAD